ncbi:MAG: hypothetical protein Q9181_005337 [Wetmoreana brouardii]
MPDLVEVLPLAKIDELDGFDRSCVFWIIRQEDLNAQEIERDGSAWNIKELARPREEVMSDQPPDGRCEEVNP